MPASLKDLRSRIKSIKNTQQITKAMKLVSTAKFGKAQNAALQSKPYFEHLISLTHRLVTDDNRDNPLFKLNQGTSSLMVVFSSERGLCGGFNNNVVKSAWKIFLLNKEKGLNTHILVVGKKSIPILTRLRKAIGITSKTKFMDWDSLTQNQSLLISDPDTIFCVSNYFDKPNQNKAYSLFDFIQTLFLKHSLYSVDFVYNRFQSALTQIPTVLNVLPFKFEDDILNSNRVKNQYITEPTFSEVFETLVPRALHAKVFQVLLDSVASEHGARMTAMDSATRNAKDMEKKLQLLYQRARQAAITKELVEIISGAEAL